MANPAFEANVKSVAATLGVRHPVEEEDVKIASATFLSRDEGKNPVLIEGDKTTLTRLLLQSLTWTSRSGTCTLTDEDRQRALDYYGEQLVRETKADPRRHPSIALFLDPDYDRIEVTLKQEGWEETKGPVAKERATRNLADLEAIITEAWERRSEISTSTTGGVRDAVTDTLELLDSGGLRVAERGSDRTWTVNQWAKQAILLGFRLNPNELIPDAIGPYWDKVRLKFEGWSAAEFDAAGFRAVPGAIVRRSAYIEKGVVLMPSFVNVGAFVGEGTMIDTWATVGSCAQVGKHCHISGGAGIGGVLEPLQANPTIVEDNCFIGARAEVAEGVIVREGSVLSMGVFITSTTPIVDRKTGQVYRGEVPPYSVVMPGSRPNPVDPSLPSTYCAVIMKTVDERTRSKTSINELLRD